MKKYLLVILIFFVGNFLYGQRTIKGVVTADKEVLIGANIYVKDGAIGTVTDMEGIYSLEIPENAKILVFSYTGYATKEVKIKESDTISVVLDGTICRLGWSRQKEAYGHGATTIKFNWDGSKTITSYSPKKGN